MLVAAPNGLDAAAPNGEVVFDDEAAENAPNPDPDGTTGAILGPEIVDAPNMGLLAPKAELVAGAPNDEVDPNVDVLPNAGTAAGAGVDPNVGPGAGDGGFGAAAGVAPNEDGAPKVEAAPNADDGDPNALPNADVVAGFPPKPDTGEGDAGAAAAAGDGEEGDCDTFENAPAPENGDAFLSSAGVFGAAPNVDVAPNADVDPNVGLLAPNPPNAGLAAGVVEGVVDAKLPNPPVLAGGLVGVPNADGTGADAPKAEV